ncbi:hypothetical protein H6P81_020375 [Aristolochia fimbriata]|uniref:F-box domain-containing protein n=1 Tax=Aristolochia fimbriata TaxID=158543 RepID=A0AAV7DU83_ARIFI|nr:hypothetical protein H6P81_020375 [Aristolochia fimbriata]
MARRGKQPMHVAITDNFKKLPNDVIQHILSFLPLKNAAQTSILSKRWRHLWKELLKHANILEFGQGLASTLTREEYADYLDYILLNHKADKIDTFRIFFYPGLAYTEVARKWIEIVTSKEVEEIDLNFRGNPRRDKDQGLVASRTLKFLPDCFYSCSSITSLRLTSSAFLPPSNFQGFTNLRCLYLCGVNISGETITKIIDNSLVLISLEINACGPLNETRIESNLLKRVTLDCCWYAMDTTLYAPYIDYLNFVGRLSDMPELEDVESLREAIIHVMDELGPIGGENLFKFLKELRHVRKLDLILKCYPRHLLRRAPNITFRNLRELELHCFISQDDSEDIRLFFTGCRFPRMEKFTIRLPSGNLTWVSGVQTTFIHEESQAFLQFNFRRLRQIKIINFMGREHEMQVLELLLERSPILEILVLEFEVADALTEAITNRLWSMPRASPAAKIVLIS